MTDMPDRLRTMAAEWDDPMCSENPVHPLLLEAADEVERMAIGLRLVRVFLAKPEWGTIQYMEGSDVYGDLDRALITIATALGENTDAAT